MKKTAESFAAALDADDFETAFSLLDENCIYKIEDQRLSGRSEIIDSYRESSDWGKENLDDLAYSSEVESLSHDEFMIRFFDRIRFREKYHTYWCRQKLLFNLVGKICFIEHLEDSQQRKLLDDFFRENGLLRR